MPKSKSEEEFLEMQGVDRNTAESLQEAGSFFNRGRTPTGCQQDLESVILWGEGL